MSGFSYFHWVLLLVIISIPVLLVGMISRRSPRRQSGSPPNERTPTNWRSTFFSANGRIGRGRWWLFHLIQWSPVIVMGIAAGVVSPAKDTEPPGWFIALFFVWYILLMWTSICLNAKRWHDRDKSGWWQLIALVPLIGGIWALIENGFLRGTDGPNSFGPDPFA